jgi:hypothetical protein
MSNESASSGSKTHSPDELPSGRPSGPVRSATLPSYGFAADAALDAASAAELAAAAESAAAEAAESAGAAGGGVVSAAGAGASVLLPQPLNTNAAAKALRASLVFIYRYPRNFEKEILGRACCWAFTHKSAAILECFTSISYLFRHYRRAFDALESREGLSAYCREP